MMIQSINALTSAPNTTTIKKPQPQKPSFEGLGVNKTAKTMKALAAAAILGMAAVGMSSCVQPTDPTPFEIPEETTPIDEEETKPEIGEDEETNPIKGEEETKPEIGEEEKTNPIEGEEETKPVIGEDEETKPIGDDEEITNPEETKPIEETPFILNDTISPALAATDEYKLLREVGFSHIAGEDVPVEAGKYQPKTGEIVELFYIKGGMDPTTYTLNREKSTEGHLVYDASSYDICYGIEDTETWTGDEFSFDSKTKTLTHYHPSAFGHDVYEYSYIKVNEDGSMVLGRYKMDPAVGVPHDNIELEYEFDNTQVCDWDPSNKFEDAIWSDKSTDYMNISFKLAK